MQTVDFGLKLSVEAIAHSYLAGVSPHDLDHFLADLTNYEGEAVMRMATLVCVDGLAPLGIDFTTVALQELRQMSASNLENNLTFQKVAPDIPGDTVSAKQKYMISCVDATQGWLNQFVAVRQLTPDAIVNGIKNYLPIGEGSLEYLGAFLDATTNYMTHTGIQTVAKRLIQNTVMR